MGKWRPGNWYTMVESPYMHDGVQMAKENPQRALELELQHQAFRKGQEAGADAMLEAACKEIEKVENLDNGNPYVEEFRQQVLSLLKGLDKPSRV